MTDRPDATSVPWGTPSSGGDAAKPAPAWATRSSREPMSIRPSPISAAHRLPLATVAAEPAPPPPSARPSSRGGLSLVPSPRESLPPSSRRPPEAGHARVQAVADALSEARAEAARHRAELEVSRRAFAAQAETFEAAKAELLATAEDELVKLAMAVATRVVLREVTADPTLVVAWAEEALAASGFGSGVVVAVASDVFAAIEAAAWGALGDRVVTDVALGRGVCELRDGARSVEVSALARIELVEDTLRETGTG